VLSVWAFNTAVHIKKAAEVTIASFFMIFLFNK